MLTESQWTILEPLLKTKRRKKKRGPPFIHSDRVVLEGILWVLKTGAQWHELPNKYPPYQTCHRRFQGWVKSGTLKQALRRLARDLKQRGRLDLNECYIDATFVPAKKGDSVLVQRNGARVRNSWQLQTALLYRSPFTQQLLRPMR